MKTVIFICLLVQVAMMSVGFWQIRQETAFVVITGHFSIIANLVIGALTLKALFRA